MNDMMLSPMQPDKDFKVDTAIRFDNVEREIKDLKSYVNEGFDKMEEYIDNSFVAFGKEMDVKFEKNRAEIISEVREIIQFEVKSIVNAEIKAEIPGAIAEGIRMYVASTQK